jgi:hypothetical protein
MSEWMSSGPIVSEGISSESSQNEKHTRRCDNTLLELDCYFFSILIFTNLCLLPAPVTDMRDNLTC